MNIADWLASSARYAMRFYDWAGDWMYLGAAIPAAVLAYRLAYRAALRWATRQPAPAVDYDQLLADARQRDLDAIKAEAAALTGHAPGTDDALLATCRHLYPDAPAWPRKENDA